MNRKEAEDYVYRSYLKAARFRDSRAPDWQIRKPELTKDLIQSLSDETGSPAIVITGSKGKGSAAVILAALLQSFFQVGLMTSPHLLSFCDRFQVNGSSISDNDFCRLMTRVQTLLDAVEAQKRSPQWTRDGGQFIPYPATWLNQRRWEDEHLSPLPQGRYF